MEERLAAALLATVSALSFAVIGLFQQRVAQFSVITILGFRVLIGAGCIAFYMGIFERTFSRFVWRFPIFRVWTCTFALTVALYGFAFIGRSLADVCTIIAFMPLIVLLIDVFYYKRAFPILNWIPVAIMFLATISPSIYQIYKGHAAAIASWGTYFALLGAVSHAAWVILSRRVAKEVGKEALTNGLLNMFAVVGCAVLLFSNTDVSEVIEKAIRGPDFQTRFLYFATNQQYLSVFFAGFFSAASVVLVVKAVAMVGPAYVAPYQYTLAIWGSLLAFVPTAVQRPEFTPDVHGALGIAAVIVAISAFCLYHLDKRHSHIT